jgi:hypothetical protein
MTEEFNLSKKIWEDMYIGMPQDYKKEDMLCLSVKDVKEFIRRLKDELNNCVMYAKVDGLDKSVTDGLILDGLKVMSKINALAGDDLK